MWFYILIMHDEQVLCLLLSNHELFLTFHSRYSLRQVYRISTTRDAGLYRYRDIMRLPPPAIVWANYKRLPFVCVLTTLDRRISRFSAMGFIPCWRHMLQYTRLPNMESSRFQIKAENVIFNALCWFVFFIRISVSPEHIKSLPTQRNTILANS